MVQGGGAGTPSGGGSLGGGVSGDALPPCGAGKTLQTPGGSIFQQQHRKTQSLGAK